MSPGFVVAILEGFEGTLEEILERLPDGDCRAKVQSLADRIAADRGELQKDAGSTNVPAVSVQVPGNTDGQFGLSTEMYSGSPHK